MAQTISCPYCASPVFADDFLCSSCELILNPRAASGAYQVKEPTIVRALLSVSQAGGPVERPAIASSPHDLTVPAGAAMGLDTYPKLLAGLDIALAPLHAFEAYVISFINGSQPVPEIAKAAKLKQVELEAVLRSLIEREVVALEHRAKVDPAAGPAPEVDVEPRPVPPEFTQPTPKLPPQPPLSAEPPTRLETPSARDELEDPTGPIPLPGGLGGQPSPERASPRRRGSNLKDTVPADQVPEPVRHPPGRPAGPGRGQKQPPLAIPAARPRPEPPAPGDRNSGVLVSPPTAWPRPEPGRKPAGGPPVPVKQGGFRLMPVSEVAGRAPPPPPPSAVAGPARPENVLQKAITLERAGDVDGAIQVLERAISRFDKPAPLYNKLAVIILNQRKDYERAEELINKALEHDPDNSVYQQNLFKVVAQAASSEKKQKKGGFFSLLRRGK